jgi:hypothetical protein
MSDSKITPMSDQDIWSKIESLYIMEWETDVKNWELLNSHESDYIDIINKSDLVDRYIK